MPWDEVARHAGTTPDAARMAGNRALTNLRQVLEKRGITAGTAAVLAGLRAMTTTTSTAAATSVAATAPEIAKEVLIMLKFQTAAVFTASALTITGLVATAAAMLQDDPAPPVQRIVQASSALTVEFADGVEWDIIGLTDGASSWAPDGSPIDSNLFSVQGIQAGKAGNVDLPELEDDRRWLAVCAAPRSTSLATDQLGVQYLWEQKFGNAILEDTPTIVRPKGAIVALVAVPNNDAIHLNLTAIIGKWVEIDTINAGSVVKASSSVFTGSVMFGRAAELNGSTIVSIFVSRHPPLGRVIAFDAIGKEHEAAVSSASTEDGTIMSAEFKGLALSRIERFSLQQRGVASAEVVVAGQANADVEPAVKLTSVRGVRSWDIESDNNE